MTSSELWGLLDGMSAIVGVIAEGSYSLPADRPPSLYVLDHELAKANSVEKSKRVARLLDLRGGGASIVLVSSDELLLESCADEIWWLRDNQLIARGDPRDVLAKYRRHVAEELRLSGDGGLRPLSPTMRRGDGRARIVQIDLLSDVVHSGEDAAVAVDVQFGAAVTDPVVGFMIRNMIGLNIYGTNTELEGLRLGHVQPADTLRVTFRFRCDLCPGRYTITAASHDLDGTWHDWMEDAIAFSVVDSRYTAGVANLRATVAVNKL